jgi:hemolysin III
MVARKREMNARRAIRTARYEALAVAWKYDPAEKFADSAVHVIGIFLGLFGIVAIGIIAADLTRPVDVVSIAIYAIGLLTMLGFSATYNIWPTSPTKWILRRLDHSAIYLMIGGTYTVFVTQMKNGSGSALLIGVWLTAAAGIVLKLLFPDRLERTSIVLYVLLGWSGVAIFQTISATLPALSLWLLAIGGVVYTIGIAFHVWRSLRFHNAIWHVFVLVAACCHYSAIVNCLISPLEGGS